MIDFQIRIHPEDQSQFARAVLSMSEWCQRPMTHPGVFEGLQKTYDNHTSKVWQTQGGAIGEPWPPLADSTIRQKIANPRWHGRNMLMRSLRLAKSFLSDTSRDHASKQTHQAAEFWTRVPYAKYHQTGTKRMPARPLYKMTKAFGDDYNAILKASLYDFMRSRVNGG